MGAGGWPTHTDKGGGYLSSVGSLIHQFGKTLILQMYKLDPCNYVNICQVSPQLSCGDTCQI